MSPAPGRSRTEQEEAPRSSTAPEGKELSGRARERAVALSKLKRISAGAPTGGSPRSEPESEHATGGFSTAVCKLCCCRQLYDVACTVK